MGELCYIVPMSVASTTRGRTDHSSWAESIRDQKHERVTLPWERQGLKPEPVKYVTRYEKAREEVEFNPVLGVYRDPTKETKSREIESMKMTLEMNRNRDFQLTQVQTYDIINHRPVVKEPEPEPRRTRAMDTRAKYNIVSNLDYSQHHFAPPDERPPPLVTAERRLVKTVVPEFEKKDFDLISNRYLSDHESKMAIDKELAKRAAADRFWQTRDFNPLVASYYDKKKEETFVEARAERERIHPTLAGRTLPPVAKASEGEAYNIVSNSAKHDDKARVVDDRLMRTTLTRVHTDVERHVTASSLAAEVKDDARKIGRIAHRRFEQELQHGHDIISNKPFKGIDAKPTFSARATKPSDIWSKIEDADSKMRTTSAGATGTLFPTKRLTGRSTSVASPFEGTSGVRTGGFRL